MAFFSFYLTLSLSTSQFIVYQSKNNDYFCSPQAYLPVLEISRWMTKSNLLIQSTSSLIQDNLSINQVHVQTRSNQYKFTRRLRYQQSYINQHQFLTNSITKTKNWFQFISIFMWQSKHQNIHRGSPNKLIHTNLSITIYKAKKELFTTRCHVAQMIQTCSLSSIVITACYRNQRSRNQ